MSFVLDIGCKVKEIALIRIAYAYYAKKSFPIGATIAALDESPATHITKTAHISYETCADIFENCCLSLCSLGNVSFNS